MILKSESSTLMKRLLTWSGRLFYWKRREPAESNKENRRKDSPIKFAGNYQGPLYAPHPDIKK
mgnify:CR=1 FL=1